MKKNKSNLLQKKNSYNKKGKEEKGVDYVEGIINENIKDTNIVEIAPKISSTTKDKDIEKEIFNKKVDRYAEALKQRILQLHNEGYGVRFISQDPFVNMSRESVRKVIRGESSVRIIAMERVRAQEVAAITKQYEQNFKI